MKGEKKLNFSSEMERNEKKSLIKYHLCVYVFLPKNSNKTAKEKKTVYYIYFKKWCQEIYSWIAISDADDGTTTEKKKKNRKNCYNHHDLVIIQLTLSPVCAQMDV
jgi:hypothetical protein